MGRLVAGLVVLAVVSAVTVSGHAQEPVQFAGMVFTRLTDDQLAQVEAAHGERCGVYVASVAGESLAARAGVKAGDMLLSVRLADETEFYGIPPDMEDMAQFCRETEPDETMRLLILRKQDEAWKPVECPLNEAAGPGPAAEAGDVPAEAMAVDTDGYSFVSEDPNKVLAHALDGSELTQRDVDIYGGLLAWAFGTRLTEAQKVVAHDMLVGFWPQAPAEVVGMFNQGVRAVPDILPTLTPEKREEMRWGYAGTFLQLVQMDATHPLSQVILEVSANARNVLAGAGTASELTQQDVDALLEYLCFQTQVQTGQPVLITPEQRAAFTQQVVAHFAGAPEEEKQTLARMDEWWGMVRAYWAAAEVAQQQALAQQWQQAYAQQQAAAGAMPYITGWQQGVGGGGQMSDSTFDAVMNSLNATHQASMSAIGSIDGVRDTSVYDSAGNWLYDY